MNEFFIPFGNILSLFRSRVRGLYNFGFNVIHASTQFNTFQREKEKLTMVLSNPAVLKVFALQCDLFSMGEVKVKKNDKDIDNDPFLSLIQSPNPFSKTQSQFLWDFMFWNMLGTSYAYVDSSVVDRPGNKIYYLDPCRIEWPLEFDRKKDKMVFSDAELKAIMKTIITYRYDDGSVFTFPFDRLVISYDLTNGIGNFFKGPSRLDALVKIISNSEFTLDADNINIRYSGKFLVGADKQTGAKNTLGMNEEEKKDIRTKIDTADQNVWPVNTMLKIQRFVSDMAGLQLSEKYLHQYFLIGNMYNIPRDVLEAYNSATYENQEKARAAHVNYTLDPKGEQFMDAFEVHFGYRTQGKNIFISWDDLPFMQIFEKEKIEVKKATIEVLTSLLNLGVTIEQANEFLGTEFEIEKPETNGAAANQAGQEGNQQGDQGEGAADQNAGDS